MLLREMAPWILVKIHSATSFLIGWGTPLKIPSREGQKA
jgi:hypothetical protein